jgi:hypothetical protein
MNRQYNTNNKNTGKTTFISKSWGIKEKCGFLTHTEVPMTYQMDERVYVVDFPGSNSLDECSKSFSLCGAMNNMILVIISIKFIEAGLPK